MLQALKWRCFRTFAGKARYQSLFEQLHAIALRGMNCGSGGRIEDSGELWVLEHLAQFYSRETPIVIFDVGANLGDYTGFLLKTFAVCQDLRIFAFEPSSLTFAELHKRLKTMQGSERVRLFNLGLGATAGKQCLHRPTDSTRSGMASLYPRRLDHFSLSLPESEEVTMQTLDSFCRDQKIEHIDLLKLDVEGHELAALQGAQGLLTGSVVDFLQFEFGGCNIDSRSFLQDFYYLLKERYDLYRILQDGLAPLPQYLERHEIFTTTNFLAARRGLSGQKRFWPKR